MSSVAWLVTRMLMFRRLTRHLHAHVGAASHQASPTPGFGGRRRASTTPKCITSTAKKSLDTSSSNGKSLICHFESVTSHLQP